VKNITSNIYSYLSKDTDQIQHIFYSNSGIDKGKGRGKFLKLRWEKELVRTVVQ
jgi:hypothetical protein